VRPTSMVRWTLRLRVVCAAGILIAGTIPSIPVIAQAPKATAEAPLVGVWSTYLPTQFGVVAATVQYRSDGTFDAVTLGPGMGYSSSIYKHFWGAYRIQPAGPDRYSVTLIDYGYAPSEICQSTEDGAPKDCRPFGGVAGTIKGSVQFLSHDSFRDEENAVYTRLDAPGLLAQNVPARLVIAPPPFPVECSSDGGGTSCARYQVPPMEPVQCDDGRQLIIDRDGRRTCIRP
jgi:hypothetical protein